MFFLGSLALPLTIGVLFPSLLGLQSSLSLMLAACLQDESPLRSGMAPPSLGLPRDALSPLGMGGGEPVWPSADSSFHLSFSILGDISQEQREYKPVTEGPGLPPAGPHCFC